MYFYRQQIFKPNEIILLICGKHHEKLSNIKLAIALKFLYGKKLLAKQ